MDLYRVKDRTGYRGKASQQSKELEGVGLSSHPGPPRARCEGQIGKKVIA